jgi:hypothetical protein
LDIGGIRTVLWHCLDRYLSYVLFSCVNTVHYAYYIYSFLYILYPERIMEMYRADTNTGPALGQHLSLWNEGKAVMIMRTKLVSLGLIRYRSRMFVSCKITWIHPSIYSVSIRILILSQ